MYLGNCSLHYESFNEIRVTSNVEEWFFIPGKLNPADHCTCYLKFLPRDSVITCEIELIQVETKMWNAIFMQW